MSILPILLGKNQRKKSPDIEDVFSTFLYTGTGAAQDIVNGIDLATEGGMVWAKSRSNATANILCDTERGIPSALFSDQIGAENTNISLSTTAFNTDGFSIAGSTTGVNNTSDEMVSWTFRNAPGFFQAIKYTGDGVAGRQIPHDLGCVPGMIVAKRTDTTGNWFVYHSAMGESAYLLLDQTNAAVTGNSWLYDVAPTDTEFTINSYTGTNADGGEYIAYLFAHDPDQDTGVVQCGSYIGNGSNNGPEIDLGWEPQWILVKDTNASTQWAIFDTMRGIVIGGDDKPIYPSSSVAEQVVSAMEVSATGFKPTLNWAPMNTAGHTYIYMAIRRGPMRPPESGSDVLAIATGNASAPGFTAGFPIDFALERNVSGAAEMWAGARLTEGEYLKTASTEAAVASGYIAFDYQNSWIDSAMSTAMSWMFRRYSRVFDVVCFDGDGVAGREVPHGLKVTPEMMIVKARNASGSLWPVYHKDLGKDSILRLESSIDASNPSSVYWNSKAPSDLHFTVGTYTYTNANSYKYIALLFASLPGISKVGSFSHVNGTPTNVDCGFATGARFVLAKRYDSTGDWFLWDSERGIVAGDDPYLLLNSTAAQVTNTDFIDPYAAGFTISPDFATGDYIFLAFS